jgi:hypothetical protein
MNTLILLAALTLGANPIQDGTLLYLQNCSSVVQLSTHSEIDHVALAFAREGEMWIYEATPAQVRRVPLAMYEEELAKLNVRRQTDEKIHVWALNPQRPYSAAELATINGYLDAQIGRRYSLENYVKKRPGTGVQCAELAASALNQAERYTFTDCYSINPAALVSHLQSVSLPAAEVAIPKLATKETWCERSNRRWGEIWSWCSWSCGEAWAFCW